MELVDPRVREACDEDQARLLIKVALLCSQGDSSSRPYMTRVVALLSGDSDIPDIPERPAFLGLGVPDPSKPNSRPNSITTWKWLEGLLPDLTTSILYWLYGTPWTGPSYYIYLYLWQFWTPWLISGYILMELLNRSRSFLGWMADILPRCSNANLREILLDWRVFDHAIWSTGLIIMGLLLAWHEELLQEYVDRDQLTSQLKLHLS